MTQSYTATEQHLQELEPSHPRIQSLLPIHVVLYFYKSTPIRASGRTVWTTSVPELTQLWGGTAASGEGRLLGEVNKLCWGSAHPPTSTREDWRGERQTNTWRSGKGGNKERSSCQQSRDENQLSMPDLWWGVPEMATPVQAFHLCSASSTNGSPR